ncbi:hypothetical protein [Chamaesiphon sp.]|uniref:hypothetical protein n=1 Tax=Chamaesiphon sp. TaxID=2814140 RepID=UPI0035933FDF
MKQEFIKLAQMLGYQPTIADIDAILEQKFDILMKNGCMDRRNMELAIRSYFTDKVSKERF